MLCVVRSYCATSSYRKVCRAKGGIGSGETLCHDIYPAGPITTVSLATNTYCTMDGHSSCAPRTASVVFFSLIFRPILVDLHQNRFIRFQNIVLSIVVTDERTDDLRT